MRPLRAVCATSGLVCLPFPLAPGGVFTVPCDLRRGRWTFHLRRDLDRTPLPGVGPGWAEGAPPTAKPRAAPTARPLGRRLRSISHRAVEIRRGVVPSSPPGSARRGHVSAAPTRRAWWEICTFSVSDGEEHDRPGCCGGSQRTIRPLARAAGRRQHHVHSAPRPGGPPRVVAGLASLPPGPGRARQRQPSGRQDHLVVVDDHHHGHRPWGRPSGVRWPMSGTVPAAARASTLRAGARAARAGRWPASCAHSKRIRLACPAGAVF